jgi:hypothetical protein
MKGSPIGSAESGTAFRVRTRAEIIIILVASLLGALAGLHPFANVTDPAINTFDEVICPFFLFAPLVADKPQWRDAPFFTFAIMSNAILYGLWAARPDDLL